jgi:AcrR family transcriptional regulator
MMDTSIPYESTGRTDQKARTRKLLIAATRELLANGITPTVEQAAAAAAISRTTAYRYFPNQRTLLFAAHPEINLTSLLGEDPPENPAARLDLAVEALARLTVHIEPELRTMLRLSLEPDPGPPKPLVLRQGRAIGWLEEALAPLRDRMPEAALRRLVLAIRAACGIEALVWLTDIGGLSRQEAVEVMRWSARALFQAAVAEASGASNRTEAAIETLS